MKLLVLGGTVFVGWHLVEEAMARGHEVTIFNRGRSDPGAFADAERILGDRATDAIGALAGRRWDAVLDTCGYDAAVVSRSARVLADAVDRYVFLSSLAVYRDRATPGQDEDSPVVDDRPARPEGAAKDHREFPEAPGPGPAKLACERAVDLAVTGRAVHLRLGLMSGFRDRSDRFPYWPWRIARGGDVVGPAHPAAPAQVMHARDLARFALDLVERRASGIYNAAGPVRRFGEILDACRQRSDVDVRFHWLSDDVLIAAGLKMYLDLPLWVAARYSGVNSCSIARAEAAGLRHRSLADLVADTMTWLATRPADHAWQAGLSAEREAEILARSRPG